MAPDADARRTLVAGTRGSRLARTQTDEALAPLRALRPKLSIDVRVIRTGGDRDRVTPLSVIGGKGVFVKEIEQALLAGTIDLAVHSLKDLPPRLDPALVLVAVPARADPRDALVSRESKTLAQLPAGSRVGTGSARRRALLRRLRPDLLIVNVRGNVDSRIRKVREAELDAVVLAAAGLQRLGRLGEAAEIFAPAVLLPPPGQGALAIEARAGDRFTAELAGLLDDPSSHQCAVAERAFLGRLGSGCTLPVAAYAQIDGDTIRVEALIASEDGASCFRTTLQGPAADAEALGEQIAEQLLSLTGGLVH